MTRSGMAGVPAGGTVLVTGGGGFLGRHLAGALLDAGHPVRILDDFSTGRAELVPAGAEVVTGSVLDHDVVRRAARGTHAVVHLAGVVGMRLAAERARAAYETAAQGTAIVLGATGGAPAVLFSSSAVYGLGSSGPMDERQPVSRTDTLRYDGGKLGYATGKLELEELGAAAAASGRPVLTVRPFNVIGPGQVSTYGMVLPTFVERALAGEPLIVHGTGEQRRCFTSVLRFTEVLLRLAAAPAAWDGVPMNVGAVAETSIRHLAETVLAETGSRSPIEYVPYESVFPGRTDVIRRVPVVSRLQALVPDVTWPSVEDLVRLVVRHTRTQAPVVTGAR